MCGPFLSPLRGPASCPVPFRMAVAMGHILPPRYIGASMVVEGLRYGAQARSRMTIP